MKETELTHKQRRRRLDFAVLVKVFATASPDAEIKRQLNGVAQSIERRFGFTEADKCRIVLEAVIDGCVTIREIKEQTMLDEFQIKQIVISLEAEGKVRTHFPKTKGHRPAKQIFPVNLS